MILWRVLPWESSARAREPGGPLFFPRAFQGLGRHDNTQRYGCMYVAVDAASAVAEAIARFRGVQLEPEMFVRAGLPLALAQLELPDEAELIDLDEPRVLQRERLRPSVVATRERDATQAYAERLYDSHPGTAGLRWWSTLESSWINVTLFDRAEPAAGPEKPEPLGLEHPAVTEAAQMLGLA